MSSKQRLVGNCSRGKLFIVSAPAGTGKSTLVDLLTAEFTAVKRSISCTTRKARAGELDGVHYHFVSEGVFEQKIKENAFLEHVTLFGNSYGTLKEDVEKMRQTGSHVVLVIDTQGAQELMKAQDGVFIFIMPPNENELSKRLFDRGTESAESIKRRLSEVEREMSCSKHYDYTIVNDDINIAYQVLRSIVIAEEHRVT